MTIDSISSSIQAAYS